MATTCDCILTHIDSPLRPGDFYFDFKADIITNPGTLTLSFQKMFDPLVSVLEVQDKSDNKATSITLAPDGSGAVIYTFNQGSQYWSVDYRSDTFEIKFKNSFSGEISVVNVTIRSIPVNGTFDPADITINVKYPYPDSLQVNLNNAWSDPTNPPEYMLYKTGYVDPNFVTNAKISPYSDQSIWIDIAAIARQPVSSNVPFYLVNKTSGTVDEESDTIGFANIILAFQ